MRPHAGVITDRYKLIHYYKPDVDDWELLDREKDPQELKNFYQDPIYASVVKELHVELDRLKAEVGDNEETPRSAYGNAPFDGEASSEQNKLPGKNKAPGKSRPGQ